MKKPIIGVVPLLDRQRSSLWMVPGYMDGIAQAGGFPVMLPLTDDENDIDEMLMLCDGFLFTGGQDVGPEVCQEAPDPRCGELCPERDRMEEKLLREAMAADKPVLGICRGIQFINAAMGGTLWKDLPSQRPDAGTSHRMDPPYDRAAHSVRLMEGLPLNMLLKTDRIGVNSYHHQAVRTLAPGLVSMAESPDGLVEALYDPEMTFLWAVQWHPEFSWKTEEASRKIFGAFVDASTK